MLDLAFDADPTITGVHLGPFPFFAISHRSDLSARREFLISAAGFWMQEATDEWLLGTQPPLRTVHAPVRKGMLAFNVLTSVGYAAVAFARAGPAERDTRGMAAALAVDERLIAAFVLAPAVLDGVRYVRPEWAWAPWTSRAAKAGSALLLIRSGRPDGGSAR